MYKITDAIREILQEDDLFKQLITAEIINYSQYARKIKPQIDKTLYKNVNVRTISTTIARLGEEYINGLKPTPIKLTNISLHTNLSDVSFERSEVSIEKIEQFYLAMPKRKGLFFTYTQSVSELTVIAAQQAITELLAQFKNTQPIFLQHNLSGVTVKFSPTYLSQPNVIYNIIKQLASRNINIIEIVSTTTELTFVVEQESTELCIRQLTKLV